MIVIYGGNRCVSIRKSLRRATKSLRSPKQRDVYEMAKKKAQPPTETEL
jgi:hypothetical protein